MPPKRGPTSLDFNLKTLTAPSTSHKEKIFRRTCQTCGSKRDVEHYYGVYSCKVCRDSFQEQEKHHEKFPCIFSGGQCQLSVTAKQYCLHSSLRQLLDKEMRRRANPQSKKCLVCETTNVGEDYNECEACYEFLVSQAGKTQNCVTSQNDCKILGLSRNKCHACWMAKCKKVGMFDPFLDRNLIEKATFGIALEPIVPMELSFSTPNADAVEPQIVEFDLRNNAIQSMKLCLVCKSSMLPTSIHIVCRPCRRFFEKEAKNLPLCDKKCIINEETRSKCGHCWWQKCLEVRRDKDSFLNYPEDGKEIVPEVVVEYVRKPTEVKPAVDSNPEEMDEDLRPIDSIIACAINAKAPDVPYYPQPTPSSVSLPEQFQPDFDISELLNSRKPEIVEVKVFSKYWSNQVELSRNKTSDDKGIIPTENPQEGDRNNRVEPSLACGSSEGRCSKYPSSEGYLEHEVTCLNGSTSSENHPVEEESPLINFMMEEAVMDQMNPTTRSSDSNKSQNVLDDVSNSDVIETGNEPEDREHENENMEPSSTLPPTVAPDVEEYITPPDHTDIPPKILSQFEPVERNNNQDQTFAPKKDVGNISSERKQFKVKDFRNFWTNGLYTGDCSQRDTPEKNEHPELKPDVSEEDEKVRSESIPNSHQNFVRTLSEEPAGLKALSSGETSPRENEEKLGSFFEAPKPDDSDEPLVEIEKQVEEKEDDNDEIQFIEFVPAGANKENIDKESLQAEPQRLQKKLKKQLEKKRVQEENSSSIQNREAYCSIFERVSMTIVIPPKAKQKSESRKPKECSEEVLSSSNKNCVEPVQLKEIDDDEIQIIEAVPALAKKDEDNTSSDSKAGSSYHEPLQETKEKLALLSPFEEVPKESKRVLKRTQSAESPEAIKPKLARLSSEILEPMQIDVDCFDALEHIEARIPEESIYSMEAQDGSEISESRSGSLYEGCEPMEEGEEYADGGSDSIKFIQKTSPVREEVQIVASDQKEDEDEEEVNVDHFYTPIQPTSIRPLEYITDQWLEDKITTSIPHIIEAYKKANIYYQISNEGATLKVTPLLSAEEHTENVARNNIKLCNRFFQQFTKSSLLISPLIRETPLHAMSSEDKRILLKKNLLPNFILFCLQGINGDEIILPNGNFVDKEELIIILGNDMRVFICEFVELVHRAKLEARTIALIIICVFCQTDEMGYESKMSRAGLNFLRKVEKYYRDALLGPLEEPKCVLQTVEWVNTINKCFYTVLKDYHERWEIYDFPSFFLEAYDFPQPI